MQLIVGIQMFDVKVLPMTGFEPRTSGVGSDISINWATTAALFLAFLIYSSLNYGSILILDKDMLMNLQSNHRY